MGVFMGSFLSSNLEMSDLNLQETTRINSMQNP